MTDPKPSYEELEARLARAEGMLEAIRSGQVDTVLGDESELVVRLAETEAALRERVKELDCLYSISHLAEEADSLAEILSGTAGIIPASWRFPEVCCTRIVLGDEVHRCGPPCGQACESCTHPCISEPVRVNGLPAGEVRVCYIDERPAADEGPFLAEECRLLRGIAEHLGRVARRFRMETALRRSEARFRSLVEEMPVMINAITSQGAFTYWNRACEEVTGYTREEVIGGSEVYTWMYPNPDYRERLAREWAENGHRFDGKETTLVARDGSLRHTIWSNLPPEVSPGGDQHWAIGVDITERKQAEEALRHNEAMLRRTEAIANVGSWEWEIEQDYVRWSEELFRIFGRDPAEGAPTFAEHPKIYPAEDMERLRKAVDACASEGTPYEVELRAVRPDGEIRHCIARGRAERDADGYIHRLVGSLQDITARKRAEEEVRRTNEQLRGTLESIGDGFFSLDEDLRVTYFNAAAERLLGRSRDDVLGRPLFEAFPEAQGSVFEENYRRALSQRERVAFEVYFDVPPYRNWYAVTVYPAENGISVYFQVITARKEAEDALRSSEENHRTTLNSIGDAVIATDTGGHVREMNPVAERLTGWTADEAMRRPLEEVFEIVNARARERVSNPVERVLATGRIVGLANHTLLINRDGTERQIADSAAPIVNDAGEVSGVVLVFRDVTEEYAAAEQLRFQAAILARISDLVTVTDPAGRILYVNDAECRMQGRAREEIVGAPVASYGEDPEKGATQEEIVSATLRDGEWRGEVVNYTADGREVILDCRTQAMRDEEGGGAALVGIATDITEQKRNEERMRQMEKMESIGQLAGGVAHDFNNQLAGIMGYGDILLARLEEPVFRGYVENILVSARRAADLTQQLLAFSRKGAYRNVPVDVHEVIHEVVGILEHSIDRRIAIRQRLEAASRAVQGDPTQIQNALLNLALNARDAMPDGGEIRFETRDATLSPESCESLPFELEPGRYLLVRVCDTGCGMAPEVRDHVFEPFYTTKEVGQGTGMGLAAVYGTVKHHRGAVAVDSEAGEGSTFTLYLPVIEAGTDEPEEPESAAEKLEGLCVLVIDDEEILRTLGVELLQDLGCEAHAEPDGEAGVAWFREHHEEVDAVILDMIMPRLSGEDAFSALREIDPGATILLASGYSASGGAEALLARGAAGFLQKPFQQAQLASKLAEAIGAS